MFRNADAIKKCRAELKLIPKIDAIRNLKRIAQQSDNHDEIRLAEKAIADLDACQTEDQLITCIAQWSQVAVKQTEERWRLMTGFGALLMQTQV